MSHDFDSYNYEIYPKMEPAFPAECTVIKCETICKLYFQMKVEQENETAVLSMMDDSISGFYR